MAEDNGGEAAVAPEPRIYEELEGMEEFSFEEASARAPGQPDGQGPGTETDHKKLEGSDEKFVVVNLMEQHQELWMRHAPAKSVESALAPGDEAMPPEATMTATGYATTMRLNRPGLGRSWWPPMAAPKS